MEYIRVKPDRKLIESTALPDTTELVFSGKYNICMMAGLENRRLLCYVIYSHMPKEGAEVYLEWMFTFPDRREEGIAGDLLKYSCDYLKARGVNVVLTKIFLKPFFAREYNSFLVNRGFIPLSVNGRMLHYRLADMLDAGAIQTIVKGKDKLPPTRNIGQVEEKYINALLSERNRTGFYFIKEECDPRFSRFYLEDEKIHAAIIASCPQPDTLYISALYTDREAEKKNMFLVLFCECLEPILRQVKEQDVKVIIMINSENVYNGLMRVFNPPEEEYLVLEHMMQLKK